MFRYTNASLPCLKVQYVFLSVSNVCVLVFAAGSGDQGGDPLDHGHPLRPLS